MTEKGWLTILLLLVIISLVFSLAIIFTGGSNSYILRLVTGYVPPEAEIKVLLKQFSLEKVQIPEEMVRSLEDEIANRIYVLVDEKNPNDVGVKDPFAGK